MDASLYPKRLIVGLINHWNIVTILALLFLQLGCSVNEELYVSLSEVLFFLNSTITLFNIIAFRRFLVFWKFQRIEKSYKELECKISDIKKTYNKFQAKYKKIDNALVRKEMLKNDEKQMRINMIPAYSLIFVIMGLSWMIFVMVVLLLQGKEYLSIADSVLEKMLASGIATTLMLSINLSAYLFRLKKDTSQVTHD